MRVIVGALLLTSLVCAQDAARTWPDRDTVRARCGELVPQDGHHGVIVGVICEGERHVYAFGRCDDGDRAGELDRQTRFEIGSITKVFTALLLADLIDRRLVTLDEPVQALLPETADVPRSKDREIRLIDLADHHSGLPRMPTNFRPADLQNPYVDYSVEDLYEFLSGYDLRHEVGERYEYSNLGVALLGQALARRAGADYETLVVERLCQPLGMMHTRITLDDEDRAHLAAPHGPRGRRVKSWDLETFAAAGGLRSTTDDMLTFVAACISPPDERFARLLAATLESRRTIGEHAEVALGWHVRKHADSEDTVWHNGATGGFSSYVGFRATARLGVVVLANRAKDGPGPGPAAIGEQVLDLLAD